MAIYDDQPLVSIIITSFNREKWIEKAISSALEQDYKNIEIIISDNKSTDNSEEIIQKYLNDPRVVYHQNKHNIGMLPNFDKATKELAKGVLVSYVCSDDYLVNKSFISEAVSTFKKYKSLVVYSGINKSYYLSTNKVKHNTAYHFKKSNGLLNKVTTGKEIFSLFQYSHLLNFGGTVFYREQLLELNTFREFNTTYFDLQTILLLALKGDFYLADKFNYIQSFHSENASGAYADAEKSLLNLSFAEIPFEEAGKINFLGEEDLRRWYYNIVKPFIFSSMLSLFKSDKIEYDKFLNKISIKYLKIFSDIEKDKKMKLFKFIYSYNALGLLFDKFKSVLKGRK